MGNLTYDERLKIFFQSPNQLAMSLCVGIIIGIFIINKTKLEKKYFILSIFSIFLQLYCIFYTQSQGAYLSIISVFLIISIYNKKFIFKKIFFIFILILTVLSSFLIFKIYSLDNFSIYKNSSAINSTDSRIAIWQAGSKINFDAFPFGIGLGNFQKKYLNYQKFFPAYPQWDVPHAHNFWLQISCEIGILALISLFIIIFKSFYNSLKKETPENLLHASLLTFFLIYFIIDIPFLKNDLSLLFWIVLL